MEAIVETKNLTKHYGHIKAVDGLNLEVHKGDVYGFLGPNGAGKSTTIRMLLSLVKPTAGEIFIFGKPLNKNRNSILKNIGCIVEKPDFYKFLSATKNLQVLSQLSGVKVSERKISETLEFVGLTGREHEPVKNYSHGMKQRLGISQTLIHNPELIILDEPTTGLDPQGIIDLRNWIQLLSKEKKKTILLSSHILSEIELIATRMVIINNGKAIAQGNVHDLLNPGELIVAFSVNEVPVALNYITESAWKQKLVKHDNRQIIFNLNNTETAALNTWLCGKGIKVYSVEPKRKLEDLFLKLISGN